MRLVINFILVVLIATTSILFWPKISAHFSLSPGTTASNNPTATQTLLPQKIAPAKPQGFSPRKWTDKNGRSFEGTLVSAKNDQVIVRRSSDGVYFQIAAPLLTDENNNYIREQVTLARESGTGFVDQIKGVYTLSRKLWIKDDVVLVEDKSNLKGMRHDRIDPMFWLFLSPKLHGANSGSIWLRVDEKTYRAHEENTLITQEQLINFTNNDGEFSQSLPWNRPTVTVVEADYRSPTKSFNVTYKFLKLAAQGSLPLEIHPEVFDLPSHAPEVWELTVFWRTGTGKIRQTVRDGSLITWP